ncbi:alpha/beta-hydrolase [Delitschia confertaspora ATCC 74209]|uniref:Alpha/beta-hydrolase n=1 Tax=Delitschia confertaspora ATCC 74209 TaxID=1513339 RepID=A0A9P4JRK1_9PLEO|nr:alpha/beta-hydrolase [Delitschia confertaspora ATCC 74209]
MATSAFSPKVKLPGHSYSKTSHVSFDYFEQTNSPAAYGYDYFVSLPPTYDTSESKQWPLILFLHGAGESQREANESYVTLRHGVPKIILCYDKLKSGEEPKLEIPLPGRFSKRQPNKGDLAGMPVKDEVAELVAENFITVTPSLNMEWGYGWNATILSALLDEVEAFYRVDKDRMHVTGFSMGGYGTWDVGIHTPDRFASLMPICGGGDTVLVRNVKHVPQWVHHGERDDIIPLSASRKMVDALKKLNADEVKFTTYPDMAHDSWTVAYDNIEVWRWVLEKKRGSRSKA